METLDMLNLLLDSAKKRSIEAGKEIERLLHVEKGLRSQLSDLMKNPSSKIENIEWYKNEIAKTMNSIEAQKYDQSTAAEKIKDLSSKIKNFSPTAQKATRAAEFAKKWPRLAKLTRLVGGISASEAATVAAVALITFIVISGCGIGAYNNNPNDHSFLTVAKTTIIHPVNSCGNGFKSAWNGIKDSFNYNPQIISIKQGKKDIGNLNSIPVEGVKDSLSLVKGDSQQPAAQPAKQETANAVKTEEAVKPVEGRISVSLEQSGKKESPTLASSSSGLKQSGETALSETSQNYYLVMVLNEELYWKIINPEYAGSNVFPSSNLPECVSGCNYSIKVKGAEEANGIIPENAFNCNIIVKLPQELLKAKMICGVLDLGVKTEQLASNSQSKPYTLNLPGSENSLTPLVVADYKSFTGNAVEVPQATDVQNANDLESVNSQTNDASIKNEPSCLYYLNVFDQEACKSGDLPPLAAQQTSSASSSQESEVTEEPEVSLEELYAQRYNELKMKKLYLNITKDGKNMTAMVYWKIVNSTDKTLLIAALKQPLEQEVNGYVPQPSLNKAAYEKQKSIISGSEKIGGSSSGTSSSAGGAETKATKSEKPNEAGKVNVPGVETKKGTTKPVAIPASAATPAKVATEAIKERGAGIANAMNPAATPVGGNTITPGGQSLSSSGPSTGAADSSTGGNPSVSSGGIASFPLDTSNMNANDTISCNPGDVGCSIVSNDGTRSNSMNASDANSIELLAPDVPGEDYALITAGDDTFDIPLDVTESPSPAKVGFTSFALLSLLSIFVVLGKVALKRRESRKLEQEIAQQSISAAELMNS